MLKFILRKIFYGVLVLIGVVVLVFVLFQGFGDPARLVMGQTGDAATQANIRKELYLDQPKWKQFIYYLNDVSPISIHSKEDIQKKELKGIFIGGEKKLALKFPYLRRSYQTKKSSKRCTAGSFTRHLTFSHCCYDHCRDGWNSVGGGCCR